MPPVPGLDQELCFSLGMFGLSRDRAVGASQFCVHHDRPDGGRYEGQFVNDRACGTLPQVVQACLHSPPQSQRAQCSSGGNTALLPRGGKLAHSPPISCFRGGMVRPFLPISYWSKRTGLGQF